jgi:prepilin-type N-terminal cleavage/methylation domain-containing protein
MPNGGPTGGPRFTTLPTFSKIPQFNLVGDAGAQMKKTRSGFTLIELIVVIVILGILAAIALPKFIDLRGDAEKSVVESFAGAIGTARSLWVAKALVCGSVYATAPFGVFAFLHFDSSGSRAPTCDDFNTGFGSVTPGPVGTLDTYNTKVSLAANPAVDIAIGNAGLNDTLSIVTKSGRTVTILVNNTTGAVSWSAAPTY